MSLCSVSHCFSVMGSHLSNIEDSFREKSEAWSWQAAGGYLFGTAERGTIHCCFDPTVACLASIFPFLIQLRMVLGDFRTTFANWATVNGSSHLVSGINGFAGRSMS